MKNFFKIILCIFCCFVFALGYENITFVFAEGDEQDAYSKLASQTKQITDDFDFSALDEYVKNLAEDDGLFFSSSFKDKVLQILSGEFFGGFDSVWKAFLNLFLTDLVEFLPVLSLIIAVAVLSSFFSNVKTKNDGIGEVVHLICFGVIASIIVKFVCTFIAKTISILNAQAKISEIIFPILLTLVASMGGVVSGNVYQPAVLIFSGAILKLFSTVLISLFVFSFVFLLVSNFTNRIKFKKFADFFASAFKWILGVVFFLFMSYLALQGITSSAFDSMKIRTAKFAVRNYVPLLGGYLSEGFDFILSGLSLVKGAVGISGALLVLSLIITPIIKMIIFSLGLKLAAGICETICDEKITNFFASTSKSISLLISVILGASFIFLIILGLLILTLNGVV